jgi:hypothetical protein
MADDPTPAMATIETFRDVAKTAGDKFKKAIEDGLTPVTKTKKFCSYEITPVKPDSPEYVRDLHRVMKQFETQVSAVRICTGV